jgi:sodium/bile acid cotransporter 7
VGVVLSPVLIGLFLQDAGVSLEDTSRIGSIYLSLFVKVWVPLLCGLAVKSPLVKNAVPSVVDAFKHNKKAFKKTQELMLALIVYRTFAQSFASTESLASASDTASVFFIELAFISLFIPGIWLLTCSPVMFTDKDRVAALYSAPQKTIALGIPLINEMFSGRPNVGVLVLPLLMYHPLQVEHILFDCITDSRQ